MKILNNHFCLIWKSNGIIFDEAIKELKDSCEVIDNVVFDKHVKSYIKYEHKPKKVQSQLTNMIVCDLETFSTDRAVPYANCRHRLSKLSGKNNRDITQREYEKCRKDCIVFKGTDSINEMLDFASQFKGEAKRINNKMFEYDLCLLAHKSSGFDSYVVLNNLP